MKIKDIINSGKDLSYKDLAKIINNTLEKTKKYSSIIKNELEEILGEYSSHKNYFEILSKISNNKNIDLNINIGNSIKDFYKKAEKIEKINDKILLGNLSIENLTKNIDTTLKEIIDTYKYIEKIKINLENFKSLNKNNIFDNVISKFSEENFEEVKNIKIFYLNYKGAKSLSKKLESGFLGFWVKKFRVSIILTILIILVGSVSLILLPKETNPEIDFGIITVTTPYLGVSPEDIDNIITNELEKEIDGIDGIKEISSTSSLGISSIVITLDNDAVVSEVESDINDAVNKVNLPADVEDPIVTAISSTKRGSKLYDMILYGDENIWTKNELKEKARKIKKELGTLSGIGDIVFSFNNDYEIKVLIKKSKLEQVGLTLGQIAGTIREYNQNKPIGNYQIGEKNYDFRFDGELKKISEIEDIPLKKIGNSVIKIKDIAEIKKVYKDKSINKVGFPNKTGYNMVSMTINKKAGSSTSKSAQKGKDKINEILGRKEFTNLKVTYLTDIAKLVQQSYSEVGKSGLQTIALVFAVLLLFIGFKESLIGTLAVPLAFLVTFTVLRYMGLTMNTLVNFSLVLSFGIAIDTTIVIIEGASDYLKEGFNPKSAVLIATRNFAAPLISGTTTTLAAFLPMMMLPGIMGKFLAFIPITVFITLLAALIISLSIVSMLFYKFNKPLDYYYLDEYSDSKLSLEHFQLLQYERRGKKSIIGQNKSLRDRVFGIIRKKYEILLKRNIKTKTRRIFTIIAPLIGLILTFIFISPNLGFSLFPSDDSDYVTVTVKGPAGVSIDYMKKYIPTIEKNISKIGEKELLSYDIRLNSNTITSSITLVDGDIRKKEGSRKAEAIENFLNKGLETLIQQGLKVKINSLKGGPPQGKAVGIKLIASSNKHYQKLIHIAGEFESFIKNLDGVKNVGNSSEETPGQFIFKLDKNKLALLGVSPSEVYNSIYSSTFGVKAGSYKGEIDDFDIRVNLSDYEDTVNVSDIENLLINTRSGKVRVGNLLEINKKGEYVSLENATKTIKRVDRDILITVSADLKSGFTSDKVMAKVREFAKTYKYPEGISFKLAGESEQNSELIIATLQAFIITIFLIFLILVLQFGSFSQPLIILYSVVIALLGVNIGLWLTNNPYSMSFGIGFIALTGIVVNDAIVLVDKYNKNIKKGMEKLEAVTEAGSSRLAPIILTTLTTLLGMLPIALQDKFWAGLGFSVIFGLFAGSAMTLNVIPALIIEEKTIPKIIFSPIYLPYKYIKKVFSKFRK